MAERRRRHRTTAEAERQRRDREGARAVRGAREHCAERLGKGDWATPEVSHLRTLKLAEGSPHICGGDDLPPVVVRNAKITEGRPEHGEYMSTSHVSRIEADIPRDCPECNHDRAVLEYRRHHNIAGSHSIQCAHCGHEHEGRTWG